MDAVAYDENYLGQIRSLPVIVRRSETTLFERWDTEFGRHELMSWSGSFPDHQPLRLMFVVHAVPLPKVICVANFSHYWQRSERYSHLYRQILYLPEMPSL